MTYFLESIRTLSYWRYALFSGEALAKILAVVGGLYLFIEVLDTFKIYQKDRYHSYGLLVMLATAVLFTIATRRPINRVKYKFPGKDLFIEVIIGDVLKVEGELVISSNSTFDTDISSGLIAANSLQGQLALHVFEGQTALIDRQIEKSLADIECCINDERPGKKKEYPIGTIARIEGNGRRYYLLAMAHMLPTGNAYSSQPIIDEALNGLWKNFAQKGESGDIVVPLFGTGRGRVALPRKKVIEKISQSFADASSERIFSNKLIIVVHPDDAAKFSLNLFQVRDYLRQSLHI